MNQPPQPSANVQRWYPHFDDQATHDAFRHTLDQLYDMHDQVRALHARMTTAPPQHTAPSAGSPSATKIAGFYVAGTPPADGDHLEFDAKSQQIVWRP